MPYLLTGILSAAVTFLGVALIRVWTLRRQILDHPNERSSHTQPTPRGGGLAIVVVTLAGMAMLHGFGENKQLVLLFASATLISLTGLLDDLYTVSSMVRLPIQFIAAFMAIVSFGTSDVSTSAFGLIHLGFAGMLVAIIWIVGFTNAFNFMDGIDGIAGCQAIAAGIGWAWGGIIGHSALTRDIGLLIASTSFAFLLYNWPPAQIFMGDVGSTFLGYLIAVVPLLEPPRSKRLIAGVLMVWPFLFDTTVTLIRRIRKRENILLAHRSHLYQRLVFSGWGHARVTILYAVLAFIGVALAIWVLQDIHNTPLALLIVTSCAVVLWYLTAWREKIGSLTAA